MELNQELRKSILNYPTLYYNRISVLLHMYCVNGTGYNWEDDGVVRCDGYDDGEEMSWGEINTLSWEEFRDRQRKDETKYYTGKDKSLVVTGMLIINYLYARYKRKVLAMDNGLTEEESSAAFTALIKKKEAKIKRSTKFKRMVGGAIRSRVKDNMKRHVDSKRKHFAKLHIPYKGYVAEWWARKTADRLRFNEPYKNEYGHGVFYPMSKGYCRISEISDKAKPEYIEAMLEVCSLVVLYEVYQPNIDFVIPYFKQALDIMGRLHMGYTLNSIMMAEALEPALAKLGFDDKKII